MASNVHCDSILNVQQWFSKPVWAQESSNSSTWGLLRDEMLMFHPRPSDPEALREGLRNLCFNRPSSDSEAWLCVRTTEVEFVFTVPTGTQDLLVYPFCCLSRKWVPEHKTKTLGSQIWGVKKHLGKKKCSAFLLWSLSKKPFFIQAGIAEG